MLYTEHDLFTYDLLRLLSQVCCLFVPKWYMFDQQAASNL